MFEEVSRSGLGELFVDGSNFDEDGERNDGASAGNGDDVDFVGQLALVELLFE